jgi:hypothetical protein
LYKLWAEEVRAVACIEEAILQRSAGSYKTVEKNYLEWKEENLTGLPAGMK